MKHKINANALKRTKDHRKALLKNLANALIKYERITTTKVKAKELKRFIEPLITRARENNTHNRRIVFSKLRNKKNLIKLFEEIAPRYAERPGGYTRRYLLGKRKTDSTEMALVEFVEEGSGKEADDDSKEKKKK